MSYDLTNKNISDTFQNLLQRTGSDNQLYDLNGNLNGKREGFWVFLFCLHIFHWRIGVIYLMGLRFVPRTRGTNRSQLHQARGRSPLLSTRLSPVTLLFTTNRQGRSARAVAAPPARAPLWRRAPNQ